jgi:glutathione S-transferase
MADLTIHLGNKNYSSWSLRPWLLLKQAAIAFDEVVIPLYRPDSKAAVLAVSPSGRVPALTDGDRLVWDSLAICEYLHENFPGLSLWPRDPAARALARAVSAEMHAGFLELRRQLPMNLRRAPSPPSSMTPAAQADIDRVAAIWRDCRRRFGAGNGDFLFGRFTIADAMYAPVVTRFRTYIVPLDREAEAYCATILALPAMQEWLAAARAEPMVVEAFEV